MFNIDKQKFGIFVATLRKEKGITQKELAERLFISDKAVSKWETAASVPSIDLLIPLADQLGVTVTELLLCRRMEQDNALSATQVEQVVKTAISYSDKQPRAYQKSRKWGLIYILSLLIAFLELWLSYRVGSTTIGLCVSMGLGATFGIYFCFFVKEKLPAYYDENPVCVYTDGLFEMNLPGLSLHNGNWGKILKVGRIWSVAVMLAYPIISYIETLLFPGLLGDMIDLFVALLFTLGGFFIPLYIVGKSIKRRIPKSRTFESMNGGTIGIYTIRDFANPNADGYGTLTGIEKYSQKEFDEHTQSKNEVEVAFTWGDRIRIKKCSGGKSHSDINVTLWYNGVTLRNGGTS